MNLLSRFRILTHFHAVFVYFVVRINSWQNCCAITNTFFPQKSSWTSEPRSSLPQLHSIADELKSTQWSSHHQCEHFGASSAFGNSDANQQRNDQHKWRLCRITASSSQLQHTTDNLNADAINESSHLDIDDVATDIDKKFPADSGEYFVIVWSVRISKILQSFADVSNNAFVDSFLPCNSHHIRDNTANQQHQNQQTQTQIHVRPVQRRTVSLDRSSVRQPAATLHVPARAPPASSSAQGRRIADGVNNITDEELNHRFSVFGIQLSLRDLDNLEPSFYNAQREDLRSFLRLNFFSGAEINDETVTVAIREILRNLDKYLERLSSFNHPDYDVKKSIENLIMKSLPFIINLITDDNSSEFGVRIERQLITFCENVYMILVKCIGVRETEKYLNEIANVVMTGRENAGNLARFPRYIIQTFLIERRSYDLSEIQEFLIVKRPSAPTVSFKFHNFRF